MKSAFALKFQKTSFKIICRSACFYACCWGSITVQFPRCHKLFKGRQHIKKQEVHCVRTEQQRVVQRCHMSSNLYPSRSNTSTHFESTTITIPPPPAALSAVTEMHNPISNFCSAGKSSIFLVQIYVLHFCRALDVSCTHLLPPSSLIWSPKRIFSPAYSPRRPLFITSLAKCWHILRGITCWNRNKRLKLPLQAGEHSGPWVEAGLRCTMRQNGAHLLLF